MEELQLGDPCPGGVVRLASGVVQLEGQSAVGDGHPRVVGDIGMTPVLGPGEPLQALERELSDVDGGVESSGLHVAVEVGMEVVVPVDDRCRPTLLGGLGFEAGRSEHVV